MTSRTIKLSDECIQLIEELAEKDNRSFANMVQTILMQHFGMLKLIEKEKLDSDRLVTALHEGSLDLVQIELAYRRYFRGREDVPQEVKNVMANPDGPNLLKFAHRTQKIIDTAIHLYKAKKPTR